MKVRAAVVKAAGSWAAGVPMGQEWSWGRGGPGQGWWEAWGRDGPGAGVAVRPGEELGREQAGLGSSQK